jgi:hypothetical protein
MAAYVEFQTRQIRLQLQSQDVIGRLAKIAASLAIGKTHGGLSPSEEEESE